MIGQIWVAGFTAFFFWGNSPLMFGLGYFFFGGYRLSRSMVLAYARPMARPEQTGLLFGALETVNSIAVIAAPVFAGFLYNQDPYLVYRVALIATIVIFFINLIMLKFILPRINPEKL
jgi:hypothetical protein